MELWDVYDKNGKPTGRTHVRGVPMEPGDYHLVVGVLVFNSRDEVFCTRRSLQKGFMPGKWENTQGGVTAGEDSLTAARRELLEETGLDLGAGRLTLIYSETKEKYGALADVYAVRADFPLESVTLQEGETDSAAWVPYPEWLRRFQACDIVFPVNHENPAFYRAVEQFLESGGNG